MEHSGSATREPIVGGDGWSHVLDATADATHYLSRQVFLQYPNCAEDGALTSRRRQLREVAVSLHSCILAILESVGAHGGGS